MFKVQVLLNGRELPTEKLWSTPEEAEDMKNLYDVFYKSKGTDNFMLNVIEVPND